MITADEYDSVQLPADRTGTIIDQQARTWSRCNGCGRHYLTEAYPISCPRCKLEYGAAARVLACADCGTEIDRNDNHECARMRARNRRAR
jgi:ribosomal protein S27E